MRTPKQILADPTNIWSDPATELENSSTAVAQATTEAVNK